MVKKHFDFENKSYLLSIILLTRKNPKGVIESR
jgi:hypothetical protein